MFCNTLSQKSQIGKFHTRVKPERQAVQNVTASLMPTFACKNNFCTVYSVRQEVLSTHADRQGVVAVCFLVSMVTDFQPRIKLAASNFAGGSLASNAGNLPFWGTMLPEAQNRMRRPRCCYRAPCAAMAGVCTGHT